VVHRRMTLRDGVSKAETFACDDLCVRGSPCAAFVTALASWSKPDSVRLMRAGSFDFAIARGLLHSSEPWPFVQRYHLNPNEAGEGRLASIRTPHCEMIPQVTSTAAHRGAEFGGHRASPNDRGQKRRTSTRPQATGRREAIGGHARQGSRRLPRRVKQGRPKRTPTPNLGRS
jgi:hypothetical protein